MKELIEKFAQKMLNEELDFLPIKYAYELYKNGIIVPSSYSHTFPEEDIIFDSNHCFTYYTIPAPTYKELIKELNKEY